MGNECCVLSVKAVSSFQKAHRPVTTSKLTSALCGLSLSPTWAHYIVSLGEKSYSDSQYMYFQAWVWVCLKVG